MRRRLTVVVAALAAMALAVPAAAVSPTHTEVLIDGQYDPENYLVTYTLELVLEDAGDEEGSEETEDSAIEVEVEGPQGQVNHGTIVSAVVASLKEQGYKGIGCVVRHFAQTDWGKGDQQVKVGDEMEDGEDSEDMSEETPAESEGSVEEYLLEVTTYCAGPGWGGDDEALDEDELEPDDEFESDDDEGSGPPPWAKAKKDKDRGGEFVPPGHQKKGNKPDRP